MMQPARVLYVSPFSHIGGGEISVLTVIDNLERARFSPSLICYEDGAFVERAREHGIETAVFRRAGLLSEGSIVRDLVRYIRRSGIRLVHVNSLDIRAGIAARLAGVPCIGHLRVVFPFTWRDRLFVRLSSATIAVSRSVVDEFCKESFSCRSKFIVMPNMVDVPEEVKPAPLRTEFNIPKDAPLVGMAGRMDPFKGHGVFIDAAVMIRKSFPEARFFIIGAPDPGNEGEEAYLEAQKARVRDSGLSDRVIFTGFRKDPLETIAALDVMVIPSRIIRKGAGIATEGFGRVAIEAMAVGVPVVSSDAGGLKEIIEDGVSGILVPMDDVDKTARAVIDLLQDGQKADTIRMSAKKRFDALYSVRAMAGLQGLYDDILKKRT
jgi:glycosyltransferase involved in cell wall biosynthesis